MSAQDTESPIEPLQPETEQKLYWMQMPVMCGLQANVEEYLNTFKFVMANMSVGRAGAKEDGEIVYYVTYWVSEDFKQIFWRLGGENSDFRFEDETNKFYHQHTAQQLPNGNILLFDNGRNRPEEEGGTYSRALELTMNTYDRIANKVWEYIPEPQIFSPNRSSAYRLENGNTLMNFVGNPRTIIEVDNNGEEVYKAIMNTNTDQGSFRVYGLQSINGETKVK